MTNTIKQILSVSSGGSINAVFMMEQQRKEFLIFSSLKSRNFRLFSMGQIVSLIGSWMQSVALSWLVLDMTKSGTQLGIITAIQFVPILLFGLFGGLLADRLPKRKVLIATTVSSGVISGILAVLVLTGVSQLWMLYVLAVCSGLVGVIDSPTRQAFVGEMVGRTRIRNAVTLNSMIFNITRVVGPSLAGIAIARLGAGACFTINALSFIAVLVSLGSMRKEELHTEIPVTKEAVSGKQVVDSIRYAFSTKKIRTALLMMALIGAFTYEFSVAFPLFSQQILHGDASTYGTMMMWMGVGSILGGLWIAKYPIRDAKMLVPVALAFGGSMVFLAATRTMSSAALALIMLGVCSTMFATLGNSTLQLNSSPAMRGRVMSLWTMAFTGVTPIGAPVVGLIGQQLGAAPALLFGGITAIAAAGVGYLSLTGRRSVHRVFSRKSVTDTVQ